MIFVEQMPGYGPPTPVPIFQWEKEFEVLLELYRRLLPFEVLEIGTYHGGTLYHWLRNASRAATIVSVDSYAVGVDNRVLCKEWAEEFGVSLHLISGDSRDKKIIRKVEALGPFDWLFIDAGHYYHEVAADWENYRSFVKPGGIAAFHDILPPNEVHPEIEVAQLWAEIKEQHHTLEIVADPEASWGGIGVVLL